MQLVDGCKHYGHLEVNVERVAGTVADGAAAARVSFTPVYSFPVLDNSYNMLGTDRRVYRQGSFTVNVDRLGRVLP